MVTSMRVMVSRTTKLYQTSRLDAYTVSNNTLCSIWPCEITCELESFWASVDYLSINGHQKTKEMSKLKRNCKFLKRNRD